MWTQRWVFFSNKVPSSNCYETQCIYIYKYTMYICILIDTIYITYLQTYSVLSRSTYTFRAPTPTSPQNKHHTKTIFNKNTHTTQLFFQPSHIKQQSTPTSTNPHQPTPTGTPNADPTRRPANVAQSSAAKNLILASASSGFTKPVGCTWTHSKSMHLAPIASLTAEGGFFRFFFWGGVRKKHHISVRCVCVFFSKKKTRFLQWKWKKTAGFDKWFLFGGWKFSLKKGRI